MRQMESLLPLIKQKTALVLILKDISIEVKTTADVTLKVKVKYAI